jgi:hypothetical protein
MHDAVFEAGLLAVRQTIRSAVIGSALHRVIAQDVLGSFRSVELRNCSEIGL